MESRRLFIGGLYREIDEADLRDRFKTFGTVSSVEIIRRTDDKGCPVKTFAYLDILQTESDFKRCVSLLSNSKWKGCCLKVQAAKESFLTRLEKERQQQNQANADTGTNKKEKHPKDKPQLQHAIPETVPKAVPGTPLPGKKNWVVGKFGRVLPVVYLRRRDRKKIAKFDPSKTTHCLKRINLEESTRTLSGLMWDLGTEVRASNGVSLQNEGKSKLVGNDNKQKDLGVDSFAFHKNAVEKQGKKYVEKTLKSCSRNSTKSKLTTSIGRDLESDSSDSYSESDSSSHSYAMLDKSSSNKAETVRADMSYIPESGCDISPSHHAEAFPSLSKKNDDSTDIDAKLRRETNVLSNENELESSSASKMQTSVNNFHVKFSQNNGGLRTEDGSEDLTEEASSTASERQSSESSDETSDSSLSESETVVTKRRENVSSSNEDKKNEGQSTDNSDETSNSSLSESENVFPQKRESVSSKDGDKSSDEKIKSSWINSEEPPLKTRKINIPSKETGDSPKKKLSNEKRLDALLEKKRSVAAQKNAIKDALKDLDIGVQTRDGKKHIVFSDDDDEGGDGGTVTEKPAYSVGEKISGSKASSWLGLVSDSDEGDDQISDGCDEESAQLVTVKPRFEGKAGEELFKLQRTFGGDKRFDLDSRFLESEEDDEDDDDDHAQKETAVDDADESFSTHVEDDIIGNLKQEKEMAMKVLSSILGGDFRAEFGRGENQEKVLEFRSSTTIHYDPTREDHKQFEQADAAEKDEEKREASFVKEMEPEDPVLPEVSQDKYYDANISSLTQLFGNKKQGASTFTFLSQEQDDNDSTAAEDSRIESAEEIKKNPWQTTSKLPYDSSGDSEDDDDDDMVVDDTVNAGDPAIKLSSQLDELFFFHPGDPGLTNRINDQTEPFMRTGSQEDVHEYWVSVRSELTQDYKRKRKDAVRRQNKLAAKRSRHR